MPFKTKPLNTIQLGALREAMDAGTGRINSDRSTGKSLVSRGLAVEIDRVGRAVFHMARTGEIVYAAVHHDRVEFDHPGVTYFFITPLGRERAHYAADKHTPRDGISDDPTLMEDL